MMTTTPPTPDARDPLHRAILDDFHDHYNTAEPQLDQQPLLYVLDTPTGTGKSAIFLKLIEEFFISPKNKTRLPIFIGFNNKLLNEQHSRLKKNGITSYLCRSLTELNKHVSWRKKHSAIVNLSNLYTEHKIPNFSPWLTRLLMEVNPPQPSKVLGLNPTAVAQQIRQSIRKILIELSKKYTSRIAWQDLLVSKPWYDLLMLWDPLQLLAVMPAPLLITIHNAAMPHTIVLPMGKTWHLSTFFDFAACTTEWNNVHDFNINSCIFFMDENDALYGPHLKTRSIDLGEFDTVHCLKQFSIYAQWTFINDIGEEHWMFMLPRMNAIVDWLRTVPVPEEYLNEDIGSKRMLTHAQNYWDSTASIKSASEKNFPNPGLYVDWWKVFTKLNFDSYPKHAHQKLLACTELWKCFSSPKYSENTYTKKKSTQFSRYKRGMLVASDCNNIFLPRNDYEMYRSSMGGVFYSGPASLTPGILENARLIRDARKKSQYRLSIFPSESEQDDTNLKYMVYVQMLGAMQACVTNTAWELEPESRDNNDNVDLFEYVRKYQGRFFNKLTPYDTQTNSYTVLDEDYVYRRNKSKIDLHTAPFSQHQPVHTQGINIKILQTQGSPEHDIAKCLNYGHTVVLSSATTGYPGVMCGTYNLDYIVRSVQSKEPLLQRSLSPNAQQQLNTLQALYETQHDVVPCVLKNEADNEKSNVTQWAEQFLQGMLQSFTLKHSKNSYTQQTQEHSIRMLGEFIATKCRNGLIMHQSNQDINAFIKNVREINALIFMPISDLQDTYVLNVHELCRWLLLPDDGMPDNIRIAVYSAKWRDQFYSPFATIAEEQVFDTTHSPLLLFSALSSADRGINFGFSCKGQLAEIDFIALTCDPYHGGGLRKDKEETSEILRQQEFLKLLVSQGQERTLLDATMAYPSESYHALMPAVIEKNAQTIIQVLGRAYRYGTVSKTRLYITHDCAALLSDVYTRWSLSKKSSHVVKKVYNHISAHMGLPWVKQIYKSNHFAYAQDQVEKFHAIDKTLKNALRCMRSGSKSGSVQYTAWSRLRNIGHYGKSLQDNITKIVDDLHTLGLPSPFLHLPIGREMYQAQCENGTYLTDSEDPNTIKQIYRMQDFLGQPAIVNSLGKDKIIPTNCISHEHENIYIEPWFVQRFLRAIVGEAIVEKYVMQHIKVFNALGLHGSWTKLKSLTTIGATLLVAARLIEAVDFFFYHAKSNKLFVVDAKYWGIAQDTREANTIIPEARAKRERIEKELRTIVCLKKIQVHYALINVAGSRIWQLCEHNNLYIGCAMVNPERDGGSWKYNTIDPLPSINVSTQKVEPHPK